MCMLVMLRISKTHILLKFSYVFGVRIYIKSEQLDFVCDSEPPIGTELNTFFHMLVSFLTIGCQHPYNI